MLIVTYIRHAICYISFHVAVNFNGEIYQKNSSVKLCMSPDPLPGLRCPWTALMTSVPQTPLLDHIILCLRSAQDQDAEGVEGSEGKGNGGDSSVLEA